MTTTAAQILAIDLELITSAERLAKYRASNSTDSIIVQQGVIDRQLDRRLALVRERDGVPS